MVFFFQAEYGIRDAQESRGLGDVYKRQGKARIRVQLSAGHSEADVRACVAAFVAARDAVGLSLIHI